MLGRVILSPDKKRKPSYDIIYKKEGKNYSYNCIGCEEEILIDLDKYLSESSEAKDILGQENEAKIEEHFSTVSKSLEFGWPKYRKETCHKCHASYVVYVSVFEPRNGWFQLVVQGITELGV